MGTTAPRASSSSLVLLPVTDEDIPAITSLWYDSLYSPNFSQIWPDTPACRSWWDAANRADLHQKPYQHYLKVVDTSADNRLIAYGKWDLAMAGTRGSRFPPWCEDTVAEEASRFVHSLDSARARVCGERPNYYLDMLATHPQWERRGAGSLIVQWGCDRADEADVVAYIDASKKGKGLYQKFGFEDWSDPAFTEPNTASMIRFPQEQKLADSVEQS